MNTVLFGNIISFVSAVLLIVMGLTKTRKKILTLQLSQVSLLAVSNAILGAYTGAVSNLIALVRNILCLKVKYSLTIKLLVSAALVGLGLLTNDRGFLGLLPIAGTVLVTCSLDCEDVVKLKSAYIISQSVWIFYDLAVKNYVAAVTDTFGVAANIIGIISVRKMIRKTEKQESSSEA